MGGEVGAEQTIRTIGEAKKIPAEDSCGQPVPGAHTTRAVR